MKVSPRRLQPVYDYLEQLDQTALLVRGTAIIGVIGLLDYATGPELSFYVFYFVPILLVTAYGGISAGLIISLIGTLAWLAADYFSDAAYSQLWVEVL